MKFCTHCGAQLPDEAAFCTGCGQSTTAQAAYQPTPVVNPYVNRNISFKEYVNTQADPTLLKTIRSSAIICYICLGITLIAALLVNVFGLIDVVILGALTLGMHIGKSKGCAIALLVCSIISTLIALISTGSFSGWLWILASAWAIIAFNKLTKAYKAFQAGETLDNVHYTA